AIRQFITGTAAAVTAAPATFTVRALAIGAACRSGSGTRTHRSHPSVRQHAFSTCAFFPQHVHEAFPSPKLRHTCPVRSAPIRHDQPRRPSRQHLHPQLHQQRRQSHEQRPSRDHLCFHLFLPSPPNTRDPPPDPFSSSTAPPLSHHHPGRLIPPRLDALVPR